MSKSLAAPQHPINKRRLQYIVAPNKGPLQIVVLETGAFVLGSAITMPLHTADFGKRTTGHANRRPFAGSCVPAALVAEADGSTLTIRRSWLGLAATMRYRKDRHRTELGSPQISSARRARPAGR